MVLGVNSGLKILRKYLVTKVILTRGISGFACVQILSASMIRLLQNLQIGGSEGLNLGLGDYYNEPRHTF